MCNVHGNATAGNDLAIKNILRLGVLANKPGYAVDISLYVV